MGERVLYHFTCGHGHRGISRSRSILPKAHALTRGLGPLIWLTDEAAPTLERLGVGQSTEICSRLTHRYRVQTKAAVYWIDVRTRWHPRFLEFFDPGEGEEHWWVVRRPLLASEFSYDETWQGVQPGAREGGRDG